MGEGSIFLPIFEKLLTFSEFGWRQSSSPLETEKKNAHCPGCQPHPCSNSEALDLNSKGGAKMTGSRDFSFYFSFIECRKKFTVVPLVAAVSVCRNSHDRSTDSCILVLGPAVQVFQAVDPTFQDGSMFLFVLCHDLGCGATCPGSLWS